MLSLLDNIVTAISRFSPEDFLLPQRYVLARAVLGSFVIGFLLSYPVNFGVRKLIEAVRSWWKSKKRDMRISNIKIQNGEFIGEVTDYLDKIKVAIIEIKNKQLAQGDTILIKGSKTKLMIPVKSMQINHQPVSVAKKGSEVGMLIGKEVCRRDLVFRMKK